MSRIDNLKDTLTALSETYISLHHIDIQKNHVHTLKTNDIAARQVSGNSNARKNFEAVLHFIISEEFVEAMRDFFDLDTLPDRLAGQKVISLIFRSKLDGWCRASFIRLDKKDPVKRVIYAVESIDEEKKRERLMTEITNQLSGSYASVVYLDTADMRMHPIRLGPLGQYYVDTLNSEPSFQTLVDVFLRDTVHPEDRAELERLCDLQYVMDAIKRDGPILRIYRALVHGVTIFFRLKILPFDDGTKFIFAFENIDDEMQEQTRRKTEREHQAALLNGLSDEYRAVWYANASEHRVSLISNSVAGSETTTRVLQTLREKGTYEECVDEYIERFVIPEDRELMREKLSLNFLLENVRVGSPYHIRFARMNVEGQPHHFQACIARVDDTNGMVGFVFGFRDIESIIQEERKKQQELEEARKAAEAANKAKSTFLFNMSHDIRTPLNAIIGFTELAENYANDKAKVNELREKTLTASYQLLDILNNVLEMARIENNKVIIEEEISDAKDFYDKWSTMFEGEMEKKQLTLHTSYDVKHRYLYLDKTHITEAFMNLLSNAVKYTTKGGDIYVSLRELPGPSEKECIMETTIRDNGIGMSAGFLEQIFESFSRARNSSTSGIQGTGLGMAIVKRLVELMHGTLTIDSELGRGTAVTIRIPHRIADSPADTAVDRKEQAAQVLKGKHILLAEDIEVNAEIVMMLLSEYGCEVEWAQDGVICVDKLIAAPAGTYDLILMDIQMPNMDGYQATGRIRKLPDAAKANIPIIAMTANAFKEDVDKALRSGMNSHLSKPIDVTKMLQTMAEYL